MVILVDVDCIAKCFFPRWQSITGRWFVNSIISHTRFLANIMAVFDFADKTLATSDRETRC